MSAKNKPQPKYTAAGSASTDLVLEVFRLNGRLINSGDKLVGGLGLTSARWQVLGAIEAQEPLSVSQIARNMGLQRQSVQRLANELHKEDIITFSDNPDHKRAKLVRLSKKGRRLMEQKVHPTQVEWANHLGAGATPAQLKTTLQTLQIIRERLEQKNGESIQD